MSGVRPRTHKVHPLDVFGLRPLGEGLRQCRRAIVGDPLAPPSKWGPSGLRILKPRIALPMWLGRSRRDRRVIITQLPNRVPPPTAADETAAGYSVRSTWSRDYRGRRMTYDSHIGTDFAIPPGTAVVAPAEGIVRVVELRMERGGLKVSIDHGDGLATMSGHLAEARVEPGQRVARGEIIGLSGMSGVDGILFCPWLAPHVHFNVLLDGLPVDPFAGPGEVSIWRSGNHPTPYHGEPMALAEDTRWEAGVVERLIAGCRDAAVGRRLRAIEDPRQRAFEVMHRRTMEPYLFSEGLEAPMTARRHARRPWLDLPFSAEDYDGVVYADRR